jgi:hypothetical protein
VGKVIDSRSELEVIGSSVWLSSSEVERLKPLKRGENSGENEGTKRCDSRLDDGKQLILDRLVEQIQPIETSADLGAN